MIRGIAEKCVVENDTGIVVIIKTASGKALFSWLLKVLPCYKHLPALFQVNTGISERREYKNLL